MLLDSQNGAIVCSCVQFPQFLLHLTSKTATGRNEEPIVFVHNLSGVRCEEGNTEADVSLLLPLPVTLTTCPVEAKRNADPLKLLSVMSLQHQRKSPETF